jgi:hypothetical protein
MDQRPDVPERSQSGLSLQAQAEFNEIHRQLSSLRFRRAFLNWLILPVFVVVLVGMVIAGLLGAGTARTLLFSITAVGSGFVAFFSIGQRLDEEIGELEFEQQVLLADPSTDT